MKTIKSKLSTALKSFVGATMLTGGVVATSFAKDKIGDEVQNTLNGKDNKPAQSEKISKEALEKKEQISEGVKNRTQFLLASAKNTAETMRATGNIKKELNGELGKDIDLKSDGGKKFKTFEEAGLNEEELQKEADTLKGSSNIHRFIFFLLQKGISPRDVEKLLPTVKILPAPKPLSGVVLDGHEKDITPIETYELPEKITLENFEEIADRIIISRANYPEFTQRWNDFVQTNIIGNPELGKKIIDSINKYIEIAKKGNQYVEGDGVNPYLLESGFVRIAYILETLSNDPSLEKTYGKGFLADVYRLLIAMGENVDGAKKIMLKGGESYIIVSLDKEVAIGLSKVGIELPIETILSYNVLYEEFVRLGKIMGDKGENKPNKFDKSLELFEELPMQEKLFALKLFEAGKDDPNLKTDKLKGRLSNGSIKLASNVYTLRQTLENDGDVPNGKGTEVVDFAKRIMKNVPTVSKVLTPKVMAGFAELEISAREAVLQRGIRLDKELAQEKQELAQEKERGKKLDKRLEMLDKRLEMLNGLLASNN